MPEPTLRTERLVLRRARLDDLDAIHAVLSDARAMRYWSTLPHRTVAQTRAWLTSMIEAPAAESDDFVVTLEGAVIGKAGFWRLPEIGFILHPSHWGRGYAFEALQAVIGHVFATRDLPQIVADVDPRNAASLRLLARLGFSETSRSTRTWLIGTEWCDSVYLALPRPAAATRAEPLKPG